MSFSIQPWLSAFSKHVFSSKGRLLGIAILLQGAAMGQVKIHGTVYDRTANHGVWGVSVIGTSGAGTTTDSLGRYSVILPAGDSISFSYLGKTTQKFPVKDIPANEPFNMSLPIDPVILPQVLITSRNYRLDSLQNREEYKKVFDYSPDYLSNTSGFGLGVSLSALLSGKKIRQIESLQRRLEQQERDKYIDHRFTKGLVKKVTGLESPALDTFMLRHRPGYELLKAFENQYTYYQYIKNEAAWFLSTWKRVQEDTLKKQN